MLEKLIVRAQSRTPKDNKPIRNIIEHKSNLILNKNIAEDKRQKTGNAYVVVTSDKSNNLEHLCLTVQNNVAESPFSFHQIKLLQEPESS